MTYDLDTGDVATIFGRRPKTIVAWARLDHDPLPSRVIAGRYHFNREEVAAWIERRDER